MSNTTTIEENGDQLANVLDLLYRTSVTQELKYGPFTNDLAQVRLGLAVLQDELDEALEAWRLDRKIGNWVETGTEVSQIAGVAIRLLMAMGVGVNHSAWATLLGVAETDDRVALLEAGASR